MSAELPDHDDDRLPWARAEFPRRRRGLGWVRTAVAAVLALCAGLAAVVAVTTTWLEETVMDRDGFAALSADLLADQQLREQIELTAQETASDAVQDADTGSIPLGGLVSDVADRMVQAALVEYFDSEQYPQNVRDVLMGTYEANIASARGPDGAPEDLQLEIAPVLDGLTTAISDRLPLGLEIDLESMDLFGSSDGLLTLPDSGTGPTLDLLAQISDSAPYWWIGAAAAALIALLIARHREWVLLMAGVGLVGGAITAGIVLQRFADDLLASPDIEGVGRTVLERLLAVLGSGLDERLTPWIWAGVALAAIGAVLLVLRLTWRAGGARDGGGSGETTTGYSPRPGRRVIEA